MSGHNLDCFDKVADSKSHSVIQCAFLMSTVQDNQKEEDTSNWSFDSYQCIVKHTFPQGFILF